MIAFIFLVIIGVAGIGALFTGIFANNLQGRVELAVGGVVAVLFSFLVIIFVMMMTTVGSQDIAIVLNGGATVGHLTPGRSYIAPWEDTVTMDNAVQRVDYQVADPSSSQCEILIRIANQQTACAKVQLRAQPQASAVDMLYKQYKSTAGVISGLVTPSVQKYANQEFQGFDPIADVNSTAASGSFSRPTTEQIAERIQADLQNAIGSQVKIDSLSIPNIVYDSTVQAQLNAAFTQKAKTVIAQQAIETAIAQSTANTDAAKGLANNSLALVQQCMTYLNTLADRGLVPNAGFSCWPGSGSGIVIPSK